MNRQHSTRGHALINGRTLTGGSTLIEVLVALAVLGTGIAGSARLLLLGVATESQAAMREMAVQRLADAAEVSWAWSGAPPLARLADWQVAAASLRPDLPAAVTATLDPLAAVVGGPRVQRATVSWGEADTDSATLRSAVYPTASPP